MAWLTVVRRSRSITLPAASVSLIDEQLLVQRVDHVAGDGCEPDLTEPAAILQEVAADQPKADFVIAPGAASSSVKRRSPRYSLKTQSSVP